ncbi:MAG TPA: hypothetical protein VNT01_04050, partial [Symbiobacteriaceae bacterium]|nr:hypothetical protein [Symbiobacteriaceae bacterium]
MGQNLKGLILMSWEILVNHQANLNLAIYYTLLGQYDLAKQAVHCQWLIIYPLFYAFSMFDSYRICLDLNCLDQLERLQERRHFEYNATSYMGRTVLSRKNPIMAAIWSAGIPGLGQFYADRGLKALTLMGWYLAVVLKSGLSFAAYYSLLGEWEKIPGRLDFQWLLFWPSIYIFGIVDAYSDCVEQNRIVDQAFMWRMRKYLRNSIT